jgi:glycosyltransferase involved in cell wall biosynthesis
VGLLAPLVWRWLVHFHRPARLIHTPGVAVRDELVRRGLSNTVVWGRGVDTRHFRPDRRTVGWRRWLAGADDAVIVLHVGRLAPEKNLRVLVDAWNRARRCLGTRATFVIAGEGPESTAVASHAPFVRQLGFIDRDSLAGRYASADFCVLPSHRDLRPRGRRWLGLPAIAVTPLAESARHDETGLLVHPTMPVVQPIVAAGWCAARAACPRGRQTALTRDVEVEDRELLLYAVLVDGSFNQSFSHTMERSTDDHPAVMLATGLGLPFVGWLRVDRGRFMTPSGSIDPAPEAMTG